MKPQFKTIPVQQALGTILCHDITSIVPGKSKGPLFRKGHVVRKEDIPALLQIGKENLYVYQPTDGLLHEDDAARRLAAAVGGPGLTLDEPREGRINFYARTQGLLKIDVPNLTSINSLGEIALATLHSMQEVKLGQAVAGTRIIPLVIEQERIVQVENLVKNPVVDVLPFKPFRVGMVNAGSEVYHGRITDSFGPKVKEKFARLGSEVVASTLTPDEGSMTRDAIRSFVEQGLDMVVVTGGMSVDPDDRSPEAIQAAGATVVLYGAPTFPGAMFMLAYIGSVPVLGLPGCVMYHQATIFDLVVPRILAGLQVCAKDIATMGHGGFCSSCPTCVYPACAFGK